MNDLVRNVWLSPRGSVSSLPCVWKRLVLGTYHHPLAMMPTDSEEDNASQISLEHGPGTSSCLEGIPDSPHPVVQQHQDPAAPDSNNGADDVSGAASTQGSSSLIALPGDGIVRPVLLKHKSSIRSSSRSLLPESPGGKEGQDLSTQPVPAVARGLTRRESTRGSLGSHGRAPSSLGRVPSCRHWLSRQGTSKSNLSMDASSRHSDGSDLDGGDAAVLRPPPLTVMDRVDAVSAADVAYRFRQTQRFKRPGPSRADGSRNTPLIEEEPASVEARRRWEALKSFASSISSASVAAPASDAKVPSGGGPSSSSSVPTGDSTGEGPGEAPGKPAVAPSKAAPRAPRWPVTAPGSEPS